jgi:Na+/proline symporter
MISIALLRNRRLKTQESYRDYSMASNDASWFAIASSLFALIGGGEIIALSAFSFAFGYAAIFLFVGYSASFAFMGFMSRKARVSESFIEQGSFSLPDYMDERIGRPARWIFLAGSLLAFVSVLILQFVTLADLFSPISELDGRLFVAITVVTVAAYMMIGGFRSVLRTDILQAAIMFSVITWLALVLSSASTSIAVASSSSSEALPTTLALSLTFAGFFGGVASADVWQRMLAARNDREATIGFSVGAIALLVFGFVVASIGILGRSIGGINPDLVFSEVLNHMLAPELMPVVAVLLFASIMSTVDTQAFLISGLISREIEVKNESKKSTIRFRILVLLTLLLAVIISQFAASAVGIYTWLFSIYTVISPFVFGALFLRITPTSFVLISVANAVLFLALFVLKIITIDNLYWLAFSGLGLYVLAYFLERLRG